jgi:hypothetical protein
VSFLLLYHFSIKSLTTSAANAAAIVVVVLYNDESLPNREDLNRNGNEKKEFKVYKAQKMKEE